MEKQQRLVQYAIQTHNSKSVLMVTEDRSEAERLLDMIGQGRLLTRTITYGPWRDVPAVMSATG